ncbi:pyroglutamylated RF-amide peptide receptor-like [Nematostella vectensis]|nr:pyroglutamylated RF-amide peptide receptor-like [Nematostella vectensis]
MAHNSSLGDTNSTQGLKIDCFSVKCFFSRSERVGIITSFFLTFLASFTGNFVVFYLLTRARHLKNCTSFSILNLCVADLLITVTCIPLLTVDLYIADEWLFGAFMCKTVTFLQNTVLDASVLILLTISIEKFTVVCFPIQSRFYRKWFRYIVGVCWFVAFIDAAYTTTFKTLVTIEDSGQKKCILSYPKTNNFSKYYVIAHSVCFFFIPLISMVVIHAITVSSIRRRLIVKTKTNSDDDVCFSAKNIHRSKLHNKGKVVVILVLIVLVFMLSWGPYLCLAIWNEFTEPAASDFVNYFSTLNKVYVFCVWMVFFNSVCHPILYCFIGRKYRDEARALFNRFFPKKNYKNSRLRLTSVPTTNNRKRNFEVSLTSPQ